MDAVPIAVFWCAAAWALSRPPHVLLHMLFASLPFGSLAVVPTAWTGGLTLVPTTVVALLLIVRQLGDARGAARALELALRPSAALLLCVFWVIAGIATLFMPRFFGGRVQVVNMAVSRLMLLQPTPQNLSQFVYVSIAVLATLAFADMLRASAARQQALSALCLGAAVMVVTGLLDHASQYLPIDALLEPLRTANYALLTDDEVLESKRVVGLMPEASVFGTLTLGFLAALYFLRRSMPDGPLRRRVVPVLMGLLLLLVWLSTSSAAYLGLGVLGVSALAQWCRRVGASGHDARLHRDLERGVRTGAAGLLLLLFVVIAAPRLFDPVGRMLDTMLLQKSSSFSYEERSMWTRVSWQALLATHGLGVGLGGTRASNFAVALASNAGLAGAAFYFLFVLRCLGPRRTPRAGVEARTLRSAIRWAYLPAFCASLTIGTTPDFGVFNAFLYGFSIALARPAPDRGACLG
ncbi:MAG TPA: hypothetical protein VMR43_17175 [Variovorax sp.]|nr:hypothetical protein [Variovorax sp.]